MASGRRCGATFTFLASLVLVPACSRPDSHERRELSSSSASAPPTAPSEEGARESPREASGPILTPEDAEADAAQRITEQNLESELDRLEREIQDE